VKSVELDGSVVDGFRHENSVFFQRHGLASVQHVPTTTHRPSTTIIIACADTILAQCRFTGLAVSSAEIYYIIRWSIAYRPLVFFIYACSVVHFTFCTIALNSVACAFVTCCSIIAKFHYTDPTGPDPTGQSPRTLFGIG